MRVQNNFWDYYKLLSMGEESVVNISLMRQGVIMAGFKTLLLCNLLESVSSQIQMDLGKQ